MFFFIVNMAWFIQISIFWGSHTHTHTHICNVSSHTHTHTHTMCLMCPDSGVTMIVSDTRIFVVLASVSLCSSNVVGKDLNMLLFVVAWICSDFIGHLVCLFMYFGEDVNSTWIFSSCMQPWNIVEKQWKFVNIGLDSQGCLCIYMQIVKLIWFLWVNWGFGFHWACNFLYGHIN